MRKMLFVLLACLFACSSIIYSSSIDMQDSALKDIESKLPSLEAEKFKNEMQTLLYGQQYARSPRPFPVVPDDISMDPQERVDLPRDVTFRRVNIKETLDVEGQTTLEDLTVNGTAIFNGPVFFPDGAPGVACNVLVVTKCAVTASNMFNSVKAAVDSITTNSATNRFVVKVGPGVFVEDTIVMKPYVALVGDCQNETVIQTADPSQDLIIASDETSYVQLSLQGATNSGKAAIVHHGGTIRIFDCRFEQNDILLKQDTLAGPAFSYVFNATVAGADSNFSRALDISDAGGNFSFCYVNAFAWGPVNNLNLDGMIVLNGTNTVLFGSSITAGSLFAVMPGDGIRIENGATAYIFSAQLVGFNRALYAPSTFVAAPMVNAQINTIGNVEDVRIDHVGTTGAITGRLERSKVFIVPGVTMALTFVDPADGSSTVAGSLFAGDTIDTLTNISPEIEQGSSLGVIFGGILTDGGGLTLDVSAGDGYLMIGSQPNDNLQYVTWNPQSVTLTDNADNFVFINNNGVVLTSLAQPSLLNAIFLGKARAQNGSIVYIQQIESEADHTGTSLNNALQQTLGPVYQTGSITTLNGTQQLDVSSGRYSYGTLFFEPLGGSQILFHEVYHTSPGVFTVTPATTSFVNCLQYDDGVGPVPVNLPAGTYAKHELFIVGGPANETYLLLFGQTVFPSLVAAQSGVLPVPPGTWTGNIVPIASIIVEQSSNSIVEILDERPRLGFTASSVAGVSIHGNLLGLLADDHPQYLLVNGTRSMVGNLDMGTFNVTNAGTYNGVTVQLHGSRHLPAGADPLTTLAPVDIGTANSIGVQNAFARSDHVHNHGNLPGGSLHAVATQLTAGFMSAADKTALDNISTNFVPITGGTMTGPLTMADQNQIRFRELSVNGFEEVRLQAPASLAATYTLTFPQTDGTTGQALITDGSGVLDWADVQALDPNLTALAALSGTGIVTHTGPGAFIERTIIGTPNQVIVANGDGVAGNPTLSLPQNINTGASPQFVGLNLSGLTASQAVVTDASKNLASLAYASTNTPNSLVLRDGSGNFSAGTITSNLVGNVTGAASLNVLKSGDTMTGALTMANQQQVRLGELTVNGTDFVALQAPASLAASYTLTMPVDDGAANQVLTTDGSGNLSWSTVQAQNANLTALAALSGTGLVAHTGPGAFTERTIIGTPFQVIVANGDGVSGNPTLSLPQDIALSSSPTFAGLTLSGFGTGVVHSDGSGVLSSSLIVNADISASAAIARSKIAAGTPNHVVINDGSGILSSEANLAVSRGGTGLGTLTSGQLLVGAGTSPVTFQVFTSTNTPNTIVLRDGSGNFSAGTITGATGLVATTGGLTVSAGGATIAGTVTLSSLGTGVVHSNVLGMLSSSQIVDADISASAAIARSKLAVGAPNHVVINDGSGALSSEANLAVSRGGTGLGTLTSGELLVGAGTSPVTFQAFTSANTPNTIVLRDAGGDFSAGTITAADGFIATSGGMTITGGAIINNGLTVRRDTTNAAFVVDTNGQSTVFAPLAAATASMVINGNTLTPSLIVRRDSSNAALTVENDGQVTISSPTGGVTAALLVNGNGVQPAMIVRRDGVNPALTIDNAGMSTFQGAFGGTIVQIQANGGLGLDVRRDATNSALTVNSTGNVVVSAATAGSSLAVTGGNSATAVTITPGTNQSALTATGNGTASAVVLTQPATAGAGSALSLVGGAATTTGAVLAVTQGNAAGAKAGIAVTGSATATTPAVIVTGGNAATAQTLTAGTNQRGLTVAGNGTANAVEITAGASTGGGLLITGGAGAGIPLQVTAAAGTGNAATFTGNATSTAVTITPGTNQTSLSLATSGTAAGLVINGGTPALSIPAGGATIVGTTNINTTGSSTTSIGTSATAGTVALGRDGGTTTILGNTTINATGSSTTSIGTSATAGTITIGRSGGTTNVESNLTIRTNNSLVLNNTANTQGVSIKAPSALAASYTLTLPVDDGTSGQVLTTNGAGVLSWTTSSGGLAAETLDAVPVPGLGIQAADSTRPAQASYEGGMYYLYRDVSFNRVVMRFTAYSAGAQISMHIYQSANGTATFPMTRVATITGFDPGATGNFAVPVTEGTVNLKAGIFFVLFGRPTAAGLTLQTYQTATALSLLNTNLFAGTYPLQYTTALAATTTPATFNAITQGTATAANALLPIIRLITI